MNRPHYREHNDDRSNNSSDMATLLALIPHWVRGGACSQLAMQSDTLSKSILPPLGCREALHQNATAGGGACQLVGRRGSSIYFMADPGWTFCFVLCGYRTPHARVCNAPPHSTCRSLHLTVNVSCLTNVLLCICPSRLTKD